MNDDEKRIRELFQRLEGALREQAKKELEDSLRPMRERMIGGALQLTGMKVSPSDRELWSKWSWIAGPRF